MSVRNRDLDCYALFDRHVRERIGRLITPELIEEHQRSPIGPQSDALARVLNYFRRAPMVGKYAVWARSNFGPYRIVSLSGSRGKRPVPVEEGEYEALGEAYHAIFLRRIADFRRAEGERK